MGYTMVTTGNPLNAYLFEPLGPSYVILTVTDIGNGNCVSKDSVFIDWDDQYHCGTTNPMTWNLWVCDNGNSVCVPWGTAKNLIQNGLATLGQCTPKAQPTIGSNIEAYPNPTAGIINISWPNNRYEKGQVAVLDLNGRILINDEVSLINGNSFHEVDLRSLPNGMYLIKCTNSETTQTIRISVLH